MLVSLHVKNLALIEETEVFFGEGLNILTGETGAGKSILLGSVDLALGAKADKELIRTGAEYALVELVFAVSEAQKELLQAMDVALEEDGTLIIQRKLLPGRSICKVNGETVSARQLKDLASVLIAIHGQNEHQTLLHKRNHLEILDDFGKEKITGIKQQVKEEYKQYKIYLEQARELDVDDDVRLREQALAEFEANEIEKAQLCLGEDEQLEAHYRKMANARKIAETMNGVYTLCGSQDGSLSEGLGRAVRELSSVVQYDVQLEDFYEQLTQVEDLLQDFNRAVCEYMTELEFDEAAFAQVEQRLNLINHLKDKYGRSIEAILAYGQKQQERLEQFSNLDRLKEQNKKLLEAEEVKLLRLCGELSAARKEAAWLLQERLTAALEELNFLAVSFRVEFTEREGFTENGREDVEFYISTNPGEPRKPLGNVASGGELSRIMLALKSISADADAIETLIFDEIDAGISGKTAWKVSEKLAALGKDHQIICITHLPQIAAMADSHFLIEKTAEDSSTITTIRQLSREEMPAELARMLGGESVTDAVLANAAELKELAAKTKQY